MCCVLLPFEEIGIPPNDDVSNNEYDDTDPNGAHVTNPTTTPEQNEQIPQEPTTNQTLMQESHAKQLDFEPPEEEKHDEESDEIPLHICNHSNFAHGIGNLSKHDMSSYCKKGYRFYNVKCIGCGKKFVPSKPAGTEEIKISGKFPLYACMNEKEKCTVAYCTPCVSLHYEEERLKKEAEKLEKEKEAEKLEKEKEKES
jgi:hypothetical protein